MEGANKFNEKQNAQMKNASGSKSKKFNVNNMAQLLSTPGVKKIKRKR